MVPSFVVVVDSSLGRPLDTARTTARIVARGLIISKEEVLTPLKCFDGAQWNSWVSCARVAAFDRLAHFSVG